MTKSCGHDSCLLASLRGFRNGVDYATRIRAAHCLVMILLYRRDQSINSNLVFLYRAVKEHGLNLGSFVLVYKILRCQLQNRFGLTVGTASFFAGGVGGAVVWGRSRSPINYQVVLYLLSRIVAGTVHHQVHKGILPDMEAFRPMAAIVWAIVMYLFTVDPKSLQGSLRSSMEFLYNDEQYGTPQPFGASGLRQILESLMPFIPLSGV
jgi:peroxisomal membrane protein 4